MLVFNDLFTKEPTATFTLKTSLATYYDKKFKEYKKQNNVPDYKNPYYQR